MLCRDSLFLGQEKSMTESETRFGSLSNLKQLWAGTFRALHNEPSSMMPLQSMYKNGQSFKAIQNSYECQKRTSMKMFQGTQQAVQKLHRLYINRVQHAFITCYRKSSKKSQFKEDSEYFHDLRDSRAKRAKVSKPKYSVAPYVQAFKMFAQIHDNKSEQSKRMEEIKPDLLEQHSAESECQNAVDLYFAKPKPKPRPTKKVYNLTNEVYLTREEFMRLNKMKQHFKQTRSISTNKVPLFAVSSISSVHRPICMRPSSMPRTSSVPRCLPNGYIYVKH